MHEASSSGPGWLEAGAGTPLVLIPGMEGSRHFWRSQLGALSAGYRVVACDLPTRPPSLTSEISDYADAILAIMDSREIERAVLVGESFGGVVTQHLAISHPGRVLALVLCNTLDRPDPGGIGLNMYTLASMVHFFAVLSPLLSRQRRRVLLAWVGRHRGFVMDPSPGNAVLADYLLEHGMDCGVSGYLDRVIAGSKARTTAQLGGITAPTLVIRGDEDCVVLEETARGLADRIPGAELAIVEGGGHCCQLTMPERTNAIILEWLARQGFPPRAGSATV